MEMPNTPPDPNDLLTISEAAPLSRLSESSLYDACDRRIIPHYRVSGSGRRGKILIKRSDLDYFMESCRVEAEGGGDGVEYDHLA
jgi:excisionase family DNA binding protein